MLLLWLLLIYWLLLLQLRTVTYSDDSDDDIRMANLTGIAAALNKAAHRSGKRRRKRKGGLSECVAF